MTFLMDYCFIDQEKVSEYNMKLMDIDSEHLGIPVSTTVKNTPVVWLGMAMKEFSVN